MFKQFCCWKGERNIRFLLEPLFILSLPFPHVPAVPWQRHRPSGRAAVGTGCSRRPSLGLRGWPQIPVAEEAEWP